jgi:DNA-binding PadR family transcriptional regulator
VLGLLEAAGEEATPYAIKQVAQVSVFNFWSVPHTQIYVECERLAKAGFLAERREPGGRRRRFYRVTPAGQEALAEWRDEPTEALYELRDPSFLKLFCGGDPGKLAGAQVRAHEQKLGELETAAAADGVPRNMKLIVDLGVKQERATLRFWKELLPPDA